MGYMAPHARQSPTRDSIIFAPSVDYISARTGDAMHHGMFLGMATGTVLGVCFCCVLYFFGAVTGIRGPEAYSLKECLSILPAAVFIFTLFGAFAGLIPGALGGLVGYTLVAVLVPPEIRDRFQDVHRRPMLYGSLIGVGLTGLWTASPWLLAPITKTSRLVYYASNDFLSYCVLFPPLCLMLGCVIGVAVSVFRFRTGREGPPTIDLPFPFHQW
jgi:hypothetical protein